MPHRDSRAVLGLSLDATRSEAQRAFRRLAKQTHPDTGGDVAGFRAVAGAWAELAAVLPPQPEPVTLSPHVRAYRAPVPAPQCRLVMPSACAGSTGSPSRGMTSRAPAVGPGATSRRGAVSD